MIIAARVAAELKKDPEMQVETVRGGLGEISVLVDDRKVVDTNRLWYPRPSSVVKRVRAAIAG